MWDRSWLRAEEEPVRKPGEFPLRRAMALGEAGEQDQGICRIVLHAALLSGPRQALFASSLAIRIADPSFALQLRWRRTAR